MRCIDIVTVGRSDYGIYLPILKLLQQDPDLDFRLLVSGMHLSPDFGSTVKVIEADGFRIEERIETLLSSDSAEGVAKAIALGLIGFSQVFSRRRPEILMVLGDRFEMYAAALAALPFGIPVAHLHGGEITRGAIDDALRHSLTKLSHLHFVATEEYAQRVIQLGEEPWRVYVTGAPSLDNLRELTLWTKQELEQRLQLTIHSSTLLVTFHPVTLELSQTGYFIQELLAALDTITAPVIFTLPNADPGHDIIHKAMLDYCKTHSNAHLIENFGTQGYFSMMKLAAAMVGNSSSGIIEAASFKLPVVNIGSRQEGRARNQNVIDVGYRRDEIVAGIQRALSAEFHASLETLRNLYGDGHAAERIVERLHSVALDEKLIQKVFYSQRTNA
jgi:UDP-hydrolysing UDP-N-acetyl-D-glucosamine 2-epimerase